MKKSYFYVLAAAVFWGIIGLFVRSLSGLGINQMQIVLLRVGVAAGTMVPVLWIKDRNLFKIRLKDIWCFIGTGIISLTFFNFCTFTAMQHTTLSVAAVLLYTSPVFVMLFSCVLFGERISLPRIGALILVFLGCFLVTGVLGGGQIYVTLPGILYGLGSGVGYALYSIFARYAMNKGYHPLTVTFYTFLFSVIGCLPLSDIRSLAAHIAPSVLLYALGLGTLCSVLPFLLYTKGLEKMENSIAAILAALETVVATLTGVLVFHEPFAWYHLAGIVLLLSGVSLLSKK